MGDVSNYGTSEYGGADLQTIMAGGSNWMARMTALLEAQERAQAVIKDAAIVGDILAKQEEARVDREAAAKELTDAKGFAEGIVAQAEKQADEMLAKAKSDASALIEEAKMEAASISERAQIVLSNAEDRLNQAQTIAQRVEAREIELKASAADVEARGKKADDNLAKAAETKKRYQYLAKRLREVLAKEPDDA